MSWFEGSQPFQITKPIRLIELFAGVGSQAKALERLGVNFEHYKVCEFDKYPMASYNAIHDTSFNVSDIQKITAEDLNICDTNKYTYILTYSFPCQDLSYAGKQSGMAKGDNTRSGLLWEVERILKECEELPQILLMENVPAVCGPKNIKDFQQWISFLESIGYKSKYQILNAKNYEVPQNRDRCFMVSWLGDFYYEFPEPIPLFRRLKDVLEDEVDEKYYLSENQMKSIINWKAQQKPFERVLGKESISPTLTARGAGEYHSGMIIYSPDNEDTCNMQTEIKDKILLVREATKQGYAEAFEGDSICNQAVVEPSIHIRKLTPKECFRLMGFADEDFDKAKSVNSNTQLYKQAGNSIVVSVLMAIFSQMGIEGVPIWNDLSNEERRKLLKK